MLRLLRSLKPSKTNEAVRQESGIDLDSNLIKLMEIFDRTVEKDRFDKNLGYRSSKNIGLWLALYSMCPNEESKQAVVTNLLEEAEKNYETELLLFTNQTKKNKTSALNIKVSKKRDKAIQLKTLIDTLAKPENLKQIIEDYQKAGGKFSIKVHAEELGEIYSQRLIDAGHEWLVKHIIIDPQCGEFTAEMENNILFRWAGQSYRDSESAVYEELDNFYPPINAKIPYLKANNGEHDIDYRLISINDNSYHVVRLGVVQNDKEKTQVYLIEPTKPNGYEWIKHNYSTIIKQFQRQKDKLVFDELQKFTQEKQFEVSRSETFEFTIQFPALASALKTIDHRTGPYRAFVGILAQFINYKGERSLFYDQKGGEVRNYEGVDCCDGIAELNDISLFYKVSGPYFMVYEGFGKSDYYPFFITDPRNNLSNELVDYYTESSESKIPPTRSAPENNPSSSKSKASHAKPKFFKSTLPPVRPVEIPFLVRQFVIEQGNNPYEILSIEPEADNASIKKSYQKKALQYHPDKYNGKDAKEKMQLINTAYQLLLEWKPAVDFSITPHHSQKTAKP